MMYNPHYVSLPEVTTPPDVVDDGVKFKSDEDGALTEAPKENAGQISSASATVATPSTSVSTPGVGMASQQPSINQTQVGSAVRPPPSATIPSQAAQQGQFTLNPGIAPRAPMVHMLGAGRGMVRGMGGMPMNRMVQPGGAGMALNRPDIAQRMRLEQIRTANLQQQHIRSGTGIQYPPAPGGVMMTSAYRPPMGAMNPAGVGHDTSQLNMQQLMFQRHQQMQQRRMMAAQLRQQQQLQRQRAVMMQAATAYPQQQQYGMRPAPMQANPPMPMQQVMQQPQYVQQTPGGMMMRAPRPPGQLTYQPGMNPTMPQQPPMYR